MHDFFADLPHLIEVDWLLHRRPVVAKCGLQPAYCSACTSLVGVALVLVWPVFRHREARGLAEARLREHDSCDFKRIYSFWSDSSQLGAQVYADHLFGVCLTVLHVRLAARLCWRPTLRAFPSGPQDALAPRLSLRLV